MTNRAARISWPAGVAFAAVAAIVGYVVGFATAPRSMPTAAPTGIAALPTSTRATGAPTASPTRLPSSAPTASPTASPSFSWERTGFPLDQYLQVQGVWGLDDRLVGLASYYHGWYMTWYTGGPDWSISPAPGAISQFWGGAVVDDQVWFLGRDEGLRPKETSMRLVAMNGDENTGWKALGPSNLEPDSPIRFLGKIRDVWVTAYIGEGGNIEIGAPQYMRTSRDGVRWSDPRVSSLRGLDPFDVQFAYAQGTRDFIVVRAAIQPSGDVRHLLLVSRDGVSWRTVTPPAQVGWWDDLACNDSVCVMTPFALEDDELPYPVPIAWASTDGLIWTPSRTILGDASAGTGLRYLAATEDGFVGIEGDRSNVAWISGPDGLEWTRHEVLPEDLRVPIIDLAASGDTVVALEQEPDNDPQGAWVGSLAATRTEN